MKNYMMSDNTKCTALQYGVDKEADRYFKKCYIGYDQKIIPVPSDMLGTPKGAFYGVHTPHGWCRIESNDFIVIQNEEILVIPYSVFKISFTEIA